ncbi:MAG: hypothetical protein AAF995_10305 [Planctomycetota bacterium]
MQITAMDVSAFQQAQVGDKVSMAVARETLDQQRAQGDAAVELIKSAGRVEQVNAATGGERVADNGLGGNLDVAA